MQPERIEIDPAHYAVLALCALGLAVITYMYAS